MAKDIIKLMPPHTRYCEPFFGGGAVLFEKPCDGISEFVNDKNRWLTNFWRVLRDRQDFTEFAQRIIACPLSEVEFDDAATCYSEHPALPDVDPVSAAWAFFVLYRQSRQGLAKDFCTPTSRTRRGMNENVSAWLSAVECLPEAHERLKRVEIRCMEAVDFIRDLDSPDTLFYCDPPYLHETRHKSATNAYEHEMDEDAHRELLLALANCKGKFILSGYPSRLYEEWRESMGFRYVDIEIDNKSSGAKKKEKKIERLWMNF